MLNRLKVINSFLNQYRKSHKRFFIQEAGNLCIVMDYCDGGDLYNKIHSMRGVFIPEDQVKP